MSSRPVLLSKQWVEGGCFPSHRAFFLDDICVVHTGAQYLYLSVRNHMYCMVYLRLLERLKYT